MARYSCSFSEVSVSVEQDLFELLAPTDATVILIACRFGQQTDAGDAAAEMLPIEIIRGKGTVTSGSGGTAGTEEPLESGSAAAGVVCELNNTTRMVVGTGSLHTMVADAFNIQVGYLYQPIDEERITVSPGDRVTVAIAAAPGSAIVMSGTITWDEIGG